LLGVSSERKLVMELQCNMALRWFVGLNLDQDAWDPSILTRFRSAAHWTRSIIGRNVAFT